ncbi:hypothetical protein [Candidatus Ruminimicrobiellum ovillum]|uniref:hypothetical protein n=1 Tax=Candidatus Ruminimicrobiellum ovillum TaxID=1947927 RepID=UPI003559A3F3
MNLKINLQTLNQLSIIYVSLPLLIFLATWLKPYIATVAFVLFIYALYCGYFKNKKFNCKNLLNNKKVFIIVLVTALLWCYFSGIGGFWYQSNDHHWRNAIFRDLINHNWPVYYNNINVALVYYIGFWLPAALIIKIISFFQPLSKYLSFFIGNELLFIYGTIGLFLIFVNILFALKTKKYSKVFLGIFIFILFSGMDIVGVLTPVFYDTSFSFKDLHLEWWSYIGQYSSNTTVLFWVFNQGIPAWLITLMFYNNRKNIENYGILALLCFFCAPLPFIGLSVLLISYFIKNLFTEYRKNKILNYLKRTFSVQNTVAVIFITPIIFLYFISNLTAKATISGGLGHHHTPWAFWMIVCMFIYFILLEAMVYLLPIYKQYKGTIMYYVVFIFLLLCPILMSGKKVDFCMRTPIPMFVILSLFVMRFLFRTYNFKKYKIRYLFLCLCLVLGSVTPIFEFSRGFIIVSENKTVFESADQLKSLENIISYDSYGNIRSGNFVAEFPEEKIFFKYLSKQ